jgi:hypothetical protein
MRIDMSRLVVRRGGRQLSIPDDWSIEAEGAIIMADDDLHVIFDADDLNNCGGWLLLTLDAEGRIVRPSNYGATMQTAKIHTPHKVADAYLNEIDGTIVIVRQYPSSMAYANGVAVPDRVTKETYGIVDGRIGLIQTQEGTHKPSYIVPESVEYPK